jgi:DNA-binding transcriptional MerR regulator
MDGWTAPVAARLTGLGYARLDNWARTGFLRPSLAEADGRGSTRLYSFRDLVALRVARELRDAGISLQGLRKVVAELRERGDVEQPLASTWLLTDGNDVFIRQGDAVMSVLRRPGQQCLTFVVDLSRVVEELQQAVQAA